MVHRFFLRALRVAVPCLLLGMAALFVWIGVSRGEVRIVLNKAIRICMECVGLG